MRNVLAALPLLLILTSGCDNPAPATSPENGARAPVPGDVGEGDAAKAPGKPGAATRTAPTARATTSDAAGNTGAAAPEAAKAGGDIPAPTDVAAPPADAEKTKSGLASKVLQKGTGTRKPKGADKVTVHYSGWTKDGKMFDSSVTRGEPIRFPLKGVIKGWTEGVQLMVTGEKTRFWIPGDLAYGDTPKRPGAPSGQLTFDIALIEIQKKK